LRHCQCKSLDALTGLLGGLDDLVLDVGDVANERDIETLPDQISADHIKSDGGSTVADMRLGLNSRPAKIDAHLSLVTGLKGLRDPPKSVVDLEHYGDVTSVDRDVCGINPNGAQNLRFETPG
jgi:hypothetical protein